MPNEILNCDSEYESPSGRAMLGTICLYASAAVLFLAMIDASSSLSFMPESWFTNRWAWYLGAFAGFCASLFLLRSQPATSGARNTGRSTVFERVVLYTREGCHLCDEARAVLAQFQRELPKLEEIDIDADPELREKFNECVPVVEIDGKVRFRGRVNEVLLRRMIDAARAASDEIVERSA